MTEVNSTVPHLLSVLYAGEGSIDSHQHTTAANPSTAVYDKGATLVKQVHQSQKLKQQSVQWHVKLGNLQIAFSLKIQ